MEHNHRPPPVRPNNHYIDLNRRYLSTFFRSMFKKLSGEPMSSPPYNDIRVNNFFERFCDYFDGLVRPGVLSRKEIIDYLIEWCYYEYEDFFDFVDITTEEDDADEDDPWEPFRNEYIEHMKKVDKEFNRGRGLKTKRRRPRKKTR